MAEELSICMFAAICGRGSCCHRHPHYVSHTYSQDCDNPFSVCGDFNNKVDDIITYESKGEIKKTSSYTLKYPRCIPYTYWQKARENKAEVVLWEYNIDNVDGTITRDLRDGSRQNDNVGRMNYKNTFAFLGPTDEVVEDDEDEQYILRPDEGILEFEREEPREQEARQVPRWFVARRQI